MINTVRNGQMDLLSWWWRLVLIKDELLLKQKKIIDPGKIYSDAREWGCCRAEKHICFLLQKENHNALFKNSCLIFSIYIMLIRVLIRILLSHVWCWTPFPEIVNTRPFTFPREFWIFIRRSEDKSWKLTHYVTLSRGSDV